MIRRLRPVCLILCLLVMVAATAAVSAQGITTLMPFDTDGRVSPAYPLNVNPPRPVLTPPETIPANLTQGAYLVVNTDNLFVRQGPDQVFAPVAIVDGGTSLIPLGWNGDEDNVWWYVRVGGMYGWVSGEFVALRGNASALPVVEISTQATLTVPRFYIGWENFIRSSPEGVRNYICLIPGGLEYEIIGRTFDHSWYEIIARCDTGAVVEGWLPAEFGFFRNPAGVDVPVTG